MLKSFMQPGNTSASRSESPQIGATGYPSRPAESGRTPEASKAPAQQAASPSAPAQEGSKLIVGPNIKLKGSEITDCEILVVEGRVEASMNSRDIRIAEGGVFSGKAEIDVAEVRGTFEGELTARKRLVIYSTGKVNGTIRYGALMVEEGGTITGNMATHAAGSGLANATASTPAAASDTSADKSEDSQASVFARNQRRHA
ncbi:bactofilin family protein [Thiobacillus sedimenti]|uniref:Polymer-forming cytoskeletal protein n=1 Tax=Thiobacillus sedimenti TaxID=3110231 RepID=A0ABZ1CJX5_9PROT|nr:polymer-forming cytoskeletal protein [Thiobacillus sp. SCUT-2]WRS39176.1 polymer-forming cytoskeletal protein [Thiobacillus sp. SCUT-2]